MTDNSKQDLYDAILKHDLDRISWLLQHGADPNGGPDNSMVHSAFGVLDYGGSIDAIVLLLRYGSQPTGALPAAIIEKNIEVVRLLLASGADLDAEDDEGNSAVKLCVSYGNEEMLRMLLRSGPVRDIDKAGGYSGMNALNTAVYELKLPMVRLLLKAGADPLAEDADQQIAYECLPHRDETNAQVWDEIAALLPASRRRS